MKKQSKIETPDELLELAIGYQKSQVLFSFVELEIPKILAEKNLSAKELAEKLSIDAIAMERFLNASVVVGLLERENGIYKNTSLAEYFFDNDSEFYLGGQIKRYKTRSYPLWENLTEKLKSWKHGKTKNETPDEEDQGADSMAEQHNLALLHGISLAKAFDFSKYKKVLDIGGGTGAMSIGLCRTFSELEATVFDLPENTTVAREFIEKTGLQNRIKVVGGDFRESSLPDNFDFALLANFMSVAQAEANKKLLARIYEKLPAGGACLLSGWIIDDTHLAPEISVLFCLEDICWGAPDVERSQKTYSNWLAEAGFVNIRCETYLYPTKMLYGFKLDKQARDGK